MNAKKELLKDIENIDSPIICALITFGDRLIKLPIQIKLPMFYTNEQWEKFLEELDFEYEEGYGGQELFGTVWFLDGTWMERGEYDGSEWWEYKTCPKIPGDLQ